MPRAGAAIKRIARGTKQHTPELQRASSATSIQWARPRDHTPTTPLAGVTGVPPSTTTMGVFGQVEKWTRRDRHEGRYNVVSIVDTPGAPRTPPRSPRRKSFSGDRAREQPPRPKRRKWLGRTAIVFAVLALALLVRSRDILPSVDRGLEAPAPPEGLRCVGCADV